MYDEPPPRCTKCLTAKEEKKAFEEKIQALEKENQELKREILQLRESLRHRF